MLECPQQGTYDDPSPKHHLYPKRTTTPPKSPLLNFSQETPVHMQHYRHIYDHNSRDRTEEIAKRLKREGDVTSDVQVGGRHLLLSTHGSPLNTVTPCAACKLLRRRCAQECPFSPYFSPHEPQKFASVHKVFGASNVSKMLLEVPESQRADAANSLVYEANIRMRDPIYGCMGAISALQHQVHLLETELNAIRAEILKHKYRQSSPGVLQTAEQTLIASGEVSVAAVPQNNIATHPSLLLPSLPSPSSPSIYTSINSNSAPATGYSSSVSNGNNVAFFG